MTRSRFLCAAALLGSLGVAPAAFAQAKPATPTTTAPPVRTKWIAPVRGLATIDVLRSTPKRVGDDMVTVLKVKNTSRGAIALLQIDEYWYNQARKIVSADTQKIRKLINPGEVIEITTRAPYKPGLYTSQFKFTHANGQIKATAVKKIE
ncbi:MAG TPA: hypothetical protein VFX12_15815 [Vicinamibacterales bacterium]|nr:hypothetical protein [Vicinamibacterales bacterium]